MQELQQDRKIEELNGNIEHIIYRNSQNGFTVMEINAEGTLISAVGEIDAGDVHARLAHGGQNLFGFAGRADGADDLGLSHGSHLVEWMGKY